MPSWLQDHDLKLLRIFHAVAESGGFAPAQVRLNLSQSSISTYMSQLENRLGMTLCTRGNAGFALTQQGEVVLAESQVLFEGLEHFTDRVAATKNSVVGDLYVGVIENSVTHPDSRVISALRSMRSEAPDVSINIYSGDALGLEDRILDGRLHCAIGLFHHQLDGIEYTSLYQETHYLYCAPGHPLFERSSPVAIDELGAFDYACRDYVDLVEGLEPPASFNVAASAPHMEGLLYLALTGDYFVYLPDHMAEQWVRRDLLRRIEAPSSERTARFKLIRQKRQHRSRRLIDRFVEHLLVQEV